MKIWQIILTVVVCGVVFVVGIFFGRSQQGERVRLNPIEKVVPWGCDQVKTNESIHTTNQEETVTINKTNQPMSTVVAEADLNKALVFARRKLTEAHKKAKAGEGQVGFNFEQEGTVELNK